MIMEDHNADPDQAFLEPWNHFTAFEKDCSQQIESEQNFEERLLLEKEAASEKLWNRFQNAATAVAQLYKERPICRCCTTCSMHDRSWTPFQDAANQVTLLYKDGSDGLKLSLEYGYQAGYQRRNKDMLAWAKKKRKNIRREDLISFLCGRTSPKRRQSDSTKSITLSPKTTDGLYNHSDNLASELDHINLMEDRKRQHSTDIIMESPNHKRQRFC